MSAEEGRKIGDGIEREEGEGEGEEEVDLQKTVVRCERQTLHRLRESGALVFAFRVCFFFFVFTLLVQPKHILAFHDQLTSHNRHTNTRSNNSATKAVARYSPKQSMA